MPAAAPTGSPQRNSTVATYSGGTRRSSSADGPIGVNVSAGAMPRAPVAHADSPARSDRAPAPRSQSRRDRRASTTSLNAVT